MAGPVSLCMISTSGCSTGALGRIYYSRMTVVLYHGSSSWFRPHGNEEAVACLYVEFGGSVGQVEGRG